jgi:hypothetical protein
LAIVEFELSGAPHPLSTMDYTYRERHGEAIYQFKDGMSRPRRAAMSLQSSTCSEILRAS